MKMVHIHERVGRDGEKSFQFIVKRNKKAVAKTFSRKTDGHTWAQETDLSIKFDKYHQAAKAANMTVSELTKL